MSIKERAVESGQIQGFNYYILPCPFGDGFNGYIEFPKKMVREDGYNGIMTYVPVHGGITYADKKDGKYIYGFDTAHSDSENFPRNDKEWIKKQIEIMLKGILKAREVEGKYLKCLTNKGKAKYAQMVQDINPEGAYNFGVGINLICGKI